MTIADAPQFLHEDLRGDNVTAFPLHRLDEDGRNFLGSERGIEQFFFDELGATQGKVVGFLWSAHAATINIGIPHMRDARDQRSETPTLLRL